MSLLGCNLSCPPYVSYLQPGIGKSSMEYLVRIYAKDLRPKGIVRLRLSNNRNAVSCKNSISGIYRIETKLHILSIFLLSHLLLADNQMISLQVNPNRQLSNQNRLFVCAQTIRTPIHRPFLETLSVTKQITEFYNVGRSQNHLRS